MTTMVEKVARAIRMADIEQVKLRHTGVPLGLIEAAADALRADHMVMARAAIEAMREPTRGMVEDGYAALMDWDARTGEDKGIFDTWVAMIDAALNEEVSR